MRDYLCETVSHLIYFRYKFKNVEDGKWGHIEAGPSGKEWNGMVAQVK